MAAQQWYFVAQKMQQAPLLTYPRNPYPTQLHLVHFLRCELARSRETNCSNMDSEIQSPKRLRFGIVIQSPKRFGIVIQSPGEIRIRKYKVLKD